MDKDYVCEDYGEIKVFRQIKATARLERLDELCEVMSEFEPNIQVEDYSDIDLKSCYGDLIDEKLLNADKTQASVSVYLADNEEGRDRAEKLIKRLESLPFDCRTETFEIREEDWANSWRDYYEPIKIGERISVVPAWIEHTPEEGEIVVTMDPGMAFGTGSHETTRLVISLMEKYIRPGQRVLDVGTGSGILAICAAKLGAGSVYAYDIDPVAVKTAKENREKNGVRNIFCGKSDLLNQVDASGGTFGVILAISSRT